MFIYAQMNTYKLSLEWINANQRSSLFRPTKGKNNAKLNSAQLFTIFDATIYYTNLQRSIQRTLFFFFCFFLWQNSVTYLSNYPTNVEANSNPLVGWTIKWNFDYAINIARVATQEMRVQKSRIDSIRRDDH